MAFIEGYPNRISVAQGEELAFHVSSDAKEFALEITREGPQPKVMASIPSLKSTLCPVPENAWANGCNWPEAHRFTIPREWPSGVYRARMTAARSPADFTKWCNTTATHDLFFIVRAATPGAAAPILMHLCTNTYNAYNKWGGHSLYGYHSKGNMRAHRVSLNRPGIGFYGDLAVTRWELPFIKWAESNDFRIEYASNCDLEFHPEILDKYKLVISVGHDEYWSWPMRDAIEAYIGRGGNVAFFSGNSVCWQVRFEDNGRTMRCHKESSDEDPIFMEGDRRRVTARWVDKNVNRPENLLTGVGWDQGGYHRSHGMLMDGSGAYTVKRPDHWVFEGTQLKSGDSFGAANTIVGYECDGCLFKTGDDGKPAPTGEDGTPLNFQILAQAPAASYAGHKGQACMGMYTRNGTVFTSATTDWADGLADPMVQRITANVLRRLSK